MDESDESNPMTSTETEIKELLGLFDAPAFVRRGQDLESRARTGAPRGAGTSATPCLRWSAFASASGRAWPPVPTIERGHSPCRSPHSGPSRRRSPRLGAPTGLVPPPPRRARDLVASVIRFNDRWAAVLDQLNLDPVNRMIDQYNRYYVLEKECVLGSARLAQRHFTPKVHLTCTALGEEYPPLPVPGLLP